MDHYNPYFNNPHPSGYGGRSAAGHPNTRGQTRGNYGYIGRGAQSGWLNYQDYQGQGGNFNQTERYPYSNISYEEHQAALFAHSINLSNSQLYQWGAGGPQGYWGTSGPAYNNCASHAQYQMGIGGPQGSYGTPRSSLNNMGSRGQHQRGIGGPQGSYSTPRSSLNNMGSRGQNQRGTGGPRGSSSTSRSGLDNMGSGGQSQRGTGGHRGSSSTSRSGLDNMGSRGQNQRGTGGPRGSSSTSRSGLDNMGFCGQNQRGTGGPRGSSSTSRSGLDNMGSRGQNQRGTGGPRGSSSTSRSGLDNMGSRGRNQRGTGGPRGSWRTSRSDYNNMGSRDQHQRDTGGSQGSWRTSRSDSNNMGSSDQHQRDTGGSQGSWGSCDQRGNQNQDTGSTVPKAQQGKDISKKYLNFSFLVQPDVVCLMKEFKVMFILRGLSGSGKSTVAETLLQKYGEDAAICSADYYRYNKQGEYVWSIEKLQETHSKCQGRANKLCKENKPVVIIDNTNVTYAEMKPYFQTAKKYGYVVVLAEPKTPWKLNPRELEKRNKHNVPFTTLSRKCEQFKDIPIFPLYFAWFVSLENSSHLRQCAKDILQDCLEIDDYKQYMAGLSGKSPSDCTVQDVTSLYSMTKTDDHQCLHITACFAPREKNLGRSPYVKSKEVQDSLGQISWITIVGWVLTPNTFSARVALPKLQQKLWKKEDKRRYARTPGETGAVKATLENLKLEEEKTSVELDVVNKTTKQHCNPPTIASHITLGTATDVDRVQAKYDNQMIIERELGKYPHVHEYILSNSTARKYNDNMWVIYLNDGIKVTGLFSGCYE